MAVGIARKFLRSMAQPLEGNQIGVSLWSVKDIEKRERKIKSEQNSTSGNINEDNDSDVSMDIDNSWN